MLEKIVKFLMAAQYVVYAGIVAVIVRRIVKKVQKDINKV